MAQALLPQDVMVLLKLVSYGRRPPMAQMAADLGLSPSQVHHHSSDWNARD